MIEEQKVVDDTGEQIVNMIHGKGIVSVPEGSLGKYRGRILVGWELVEGKLFYHILEE